jgi:hypothetical protein
VKRWSTLAKTLVVLGLAGCGESTAPAAGGGAGGMGGNGGASGGVSGSSSSAGGGAAGVGQAGATSGAGSGGQPLENTGSAPLTLESIALDTAAPGTAAFELVAPPAPGTALAGGAMQELEVQFNPSAEQLYESSIVIQASGTAAETRVALFGLGTQGLEGENEPFLKIVLTALGYDVDVGGEGLLSTTTPLVGSEVAAQRFEASGAEPIELVPVARYSPEEPIPYGYYTASAEIEVGVISSDQFQELNPGTDAGSETTFAPPGAPFGIFTVSETHSTYSEDSKNAGNQVAHAVRSYPLKDRAGAAIPNAYLVCFEEAANGDYQDYVFTLRNVKPVAP